MIAIAIREPGSPDVLVPVERPIPGIGPHDLLIKVAAAGVNRPDVMQRQGRYAPPPGTSDIPGLEVAGTVAAVGSGVTGWAVGDRVCALVAGGGYAEFCAAPAPQCLPVPAGLDLAHAAGLPEVMFTVWTNVFERGRLAAGESILIHGGSSGIGTAAIQLARARGARVFTTAGTDEKCAACEAIGAERCINYRDQDFVAVVKELTGDRGVDVVLDMVGGDYLQRNIDVLAMDGRLVQIAQLGGYRSTINTIPILQRRLTITGSTLRPRSIEEKGRHRPRRTAARVAAHRIGRGAGARARLFSAQPGGRGAPGDGIQHAHRQADPSSRIDEIAYETFPVCCECRRHPRGLHRLRFQRQFPIFQWRDRLEFNHHAAGCRGQGRHRHRRHERQDRHRALHRLALQRIGRRPPRHQVRQLARSKPAVLLHARRGPGHQGMGPGRGRHESRRSAHASPSHRASATAAPAPAA